MIFGDLNFYPSITAFVLPDAVSEALALSFAYSSLAAYQVEQVSTLESSILIVQLRLRRLPRKRRLIYSSSEAVGPLNAHLAMFQPALRY